MNTFYFPQTCYKFISYDRISQDFDDLFSLVKNHKLITHKHALNQLINIYGDSLQRGKITFPTSDDFTIIGKI